MGIDPGYCRIESVTWGLRFGIGCCQPLSKLVRMFLIANEEDSMLEDRRR